ncbi:hydantoinase/oxoprolinase N-terminal domain-containing protein [Alicyclobacillus macrosporangiidus]|uniref:hydantoinase/oxoprolinase N-terminal domain-containing protein n=1 Tax=Alicyclobacillus macrosporangiidus TaxID=392015 RepID=UPI000494E5F0|nr:hydantoinase/oxoprolinase family protein [Alicyclobacillus macrosporangiidus]
MRIGIDVGGTNTDAVVMDGQRVVTCAKTATTKDVLTGILTVLRTVLAECPATAVNAVMLGTTHFANALVERDRLSKTAVLRLGLPYGAALPPFVDFPAELREVIRGPVYLLPGGHEFDGREITPFDESRVRAAAREIRAAGIRTAVVSSPFSPINDEMERRAADILYEECPGIRVTISADIGSVGLLERENAAILNASLVLLAEEIVDALEQALRSLGLTCPFYLTQNDGTLMNADYARRFPVLTISSGPTNSMRGASYLSGLKNAIVIDVGGTTADVGVLVNGFPRPAARTTELAGVRTNFRMPDVYSLGLGGGSRVRFAEDGTPVIGPTSVGYRIREEALIFGGSTLTMTDVVVAAGLAEIGDPSRVPLTPQEAQRVLDKADEMLAECVDRMKPSRADMPAVVVGGGSILIRDSLKGVSTIVRPEYHAVANAIGAAIAQVGGEVDRVYSFEGRSRESVLNEAKEQAILRAMEAGADPATIEIVELQEIPLAYLPSRASRIRVKAIGELKGARVNDLVTDGR